MSFHHLLTENPIPVVGIEAAVGHSLDDKSLKKLPAPDKPVKLTDGGGLYLHRLPSGISAWRFKFRHAGKPDEVTIGRFPDVSLGEARADAAALRRLLAGGTDPKAWAARIEAQKRAEAQHKAETFRVIAERYFAARSPTWTATHARDVRRILDELNDGRPTDDRPKPPALGDLPIRDIRKSHVREVVDAIVLRGALTYVRDVLLYCRKVVEFFNAGHDDDPIADPTAGLRDVLPSRQEGRHAALKPDEMPEFLRALRLARCEPETRLGIRLLLLTALRTTELRLATWPEVDFEARRWSVPGERMKYRRRFKSGDIPPHEIPLARQTLDTLRDLHSLTGDAGRLFPGNRGPDSYMSEATMLAVIKRMGFDGRMTGHGCRAVFSTWAHDRGYSTEVIERALSHLDPNAVRAAYDRGDRWRSRVELMQAWADQLDTWERADNILTLRGAK